jgi:hypothetical protein
MRKKLFSWIQILASTLFLVSAFLIVRLLHNVDHRTADALDVFSLSMKEFVSHRRNDRDFIQDAICSGCRHALVTRHSNPNNNQTLATTRCGVLIHQLMYHPINTPQISLVHAVQQVANEYPVDCKLCRSCSPRDQKYWRYDRILDAANASSGRTLLLPSVPNKHRIPNSAMRNMTAYFLDPRNAYPHREYLFDYNPSIVLLPTSIRPTATAYYLASFRVSNRHFCLRPSDRQLMMRGIKTTPAQEWLGLALLDQDLNMLQDTVLDMRDTDFAKQGGAEDYRLFVLPTSNRSLQLYVASNDMIAPIWIHDDAPADSHIVPTRVFEPLLSSSTTDLVVSMRPFVSCAPCFKARRRGLCGKNFNYFVNASGQVLAEVWPSAPHMARVVNLQERCQRQLEPEQTVDVNNASLLPSFATLEELYFPNLEANQMLLTRGRGGVCCIDMQHPIRTHPTLRVGIMHSKTPSQGKNRLPMSSGLSESGPTAGSTTNATASSSSSLMDNHYLSRLYAFEPTAPYRMVAVSGLFCFGFPSPQEERAVPLVRLTRWRKLRIGQEYDCPRIHFVSGMTVAADDPESVIIAYGINDCVSRFLKVSLQELGRILFSGMGE